MSAYFFPESDGPPCRLLGGRASDFDLWGERGVGVLVQDDPRVRQRDVGDGDDDLRVAHVVLPAAVGHVVDPLTIALGRDSQEMEF